MSKQHFQTFVYILKCHTNCLAILENPKKKFELNRSTVHEQPDPPPSHQREEDPGEQSQKAQLHTPDDRRRSLRCREPRNYSPCWPCPKHRRCLAPPRLCRPWSALRTSSQGCLLQVLPHLELHLDQERS